MKPKKKISTESELIRLESRVSLIRNSKESENTYYLRKLREMNEQEFDAISKLLDKNPYRSDYDIAKEVFFG